MSNRQHYLNTNIVSFIHDRAYKLNEDIIDSNRIKQLFVNPALALDYFVHPGRCPAAKNQSEITQYDVLCGRGGFINGHDGNRRYRSIISLYQPTYISAERRKKPLVITVLVEHVRKRGGRFLKRDKDSGMWYEIGDDKAGLKTSQALRDSLEERANRHCKSAKRLSEVGHIPVTKTHRKNGVEGNIKQVTQQEIRKDVSFKYRDFCRRDEDSRMIGRTFSDNQHTFSVKSRDIFRCEREERRMDCNFSSSQNPCNAHSERSFVAPNVDEDMCYKGEKIKKSMKHSCDQDNWFLGDLFEPLPYKKENKPTSPFSIPSHSCLNRAIVTPTHSFEPTSSFECENADSYYNDTVNSFVPSNENNTNNQNHSPFCEIRYRIMLQYKGDNPENT